MKTSNTYRYIQNTFLIISVVMYSSFLFAQPGRGSIFSIKSSPNTLFMVSINGVLQNESPTSEIKITGIPGNECQFLIIVTNPEFQIINNYLGFVPGMETRLGIHRSPYGNYYLAKEQEVDPYYSAPYPNQNVIQYRNVLPPVMDISRPPMPLGGGQNSPPGINIEIIHHHVYPSNQNDPEVVINPEPEPPVITGCTTPLPGDQFYNALNSIKAASFESSKLTVAKQISSNNCLNTFQIKQIMNTFSFEGTKLEFAEFAWTNCVNRQEYYLVNEAFSFDSSIDKLNEFIQNQQ